ncbi:hypothetical protein V502_10835 [Pseudogymnoascus sp. VKM F-4520 (FW-2644)]|nr:hypothetical protein V502_10835 [Pseudogymnoascus sp. VKM F-4520 (FW-2644)]
MSISLVTESFQSLELHVKGNVCTMACAGHDPSQKITRNRTATTVMLPKPCTTEEKKQESFPDGGLQAWSQVFMGHLMNFNTWGYINSFGLFGAHYINNLHFSASAVAWIGSVQIFLLFFIGVVSGSALDAGYYRQVLITGCFFQIFGIFMTSLATTYWEIFLAQGICQGIGHGLVFAPTVGLVATYFSKHRSLAVAITTGGSGTGGVVFVLLAQYLSPVLGFQWTVRIMGFVVLFNALIIISLVRPRLMERNIGSIFDWKAFKELPYTLFVIGMFFSLWPVFYDFTFINIFTTNVIGTPSSRSLTPLLIINAVSLPGCVISGVIADRILGSLNTLILLILMCAFLNFVWISISTYGGILAFVTVLGLINGALQSMFISALSSLTSDMSKIGRRSGMVMAAIAFSTLTGGPIAGSLIEKDGGGFLGVQIFGGTIMLVGCGIMITARAAKTGWVVIERL